MQLLATFGSTCQQWFFNSKSSTFRCVW